MKNPIHALLLGLALVATVSACGKKSNPPSNANGLATNTVQTGFQDTTVKKMSDEAKCQNEIPVNKGPEGWKEVQLKDLQGPKDGVYQLVMVRTNTALLTKDNRVISGSTTTTLSLDENLAIKEVAQAVDCKDLQPEDTLAQPASPILAMNASTGEYTQRLGVKYTLTSTDDVKSNQAYTPKAGKTFFAELQSTPQEIQNLRANGEDLAVKYYKSAEGNIEVRAASLKKARQNQPEFQKQVMNIAVTFQLVKAPADGALK